MSTPRVMGSCARLLGIRSDTAQLYALVLHPHFTHIAYGDLPASRRVLAAGLGLRNWPLDVLTRPHMTCALRDGVHATPRLLTRPRRRDRGRRLSSMSYEGSACLPLLVEEAGGRVTDLTGADEWSHHHWRDGETAGVTGRGP